MAEYTFYVKQHKEMTEVILGFETSNRYSITTSNGSLMASAQESSGWISRQILRGLRPFVMNVTDPNGKNMMTLDKGFAFMLHRLEVRNSSGKYIGAIQRKFSIFHRDYIIEDPAHRTLFQISGPVWWPWTFNVMQNDVQKGLIKKKWSGFLKESFTDADNFSVTCPAEWDGNVKQLLLAAVLLIDFIHFEN
ncbi:MAG: scramblase [Candidatus Riflebacteria bacterium]|nr:scramblase [Candidatus Riflebacteria bacterium]